VAVRRADAGFVGIDPDARNSGVAGIVSLGQSLDPAISQ
jgi:hypothetical protein